MRPYGLIAVFTLMVGGIVAGAAYFHDRQAESLRAGRRLVINGTTSLHAAQVSDWLSARIQETERAARVGKRLLRSDGKRSNPAFGGSIPMAHGFLRFCSRSMAVPCISSMRPAPSASISILGPATTGWPCGMCDSTDRSETRQSLPTEIRQDSFLPSSHRSERPALMEPQSAMRLRRSMQRRR